MTDHPDDIMSCGAPALRDYAVFFCEVCDGEASDWELRTALIVLRDYDMLEEADKLERRARPEEDHG